MTTLATVTAGPAAAAPSGGLGSVPHTAAVIVDDVAQARVRSVLELPLHRFLQVELVDVADPTAGLAFPAVGGALNNVGMLHGGVVYALLDVAAYLALLPHLGAQEHAVTHDLSVQLVRPVSAGGRVEVVGEVVRKGRAVAFLRSEARVYGRVVASAQVTKTLVAPG